MIPYALFLALALQSGNSPINPPNRGNALYSDCQALTRMLDGQPSTVVEVQSGSSCTDYIDGFTDGYEAAGPSLCVGGASLGTLARVYIAYMQKKPKLLDQHKSVGLLMALKDAYPCRNP